MTPSADRKHSDGRFRTRAEVSRRLTDHDRAVLHAEVRRLVLALSPFGVLRRDVLARAAGATRWSDETFEEALTAAVEGGEIKKLPLDFYAIGRK